MKTRFFGDVHGKVREFSSILENLPSDVTSVVQVGDMGVGFDQSAYWHEKLDELLMNANARFLRGNHDNPTTCTSMKSWIRDGLVENDIMYCGGAWSIDRSFRIEGIDWWKDEELSYEELNRVLNIYDIVRPRIMVTHDCPLSVSKKLFIDSSRSFSNQQFHTRTGAALDAMFDMHQPKLFVFGHWHYDADEVINGTRFICLNELSYIDVDMETLKVTWESTI
jgi:Icc-related predicted phosphoesterase